MKYAGYVLYQSDLLIKRLENGEILSIEEYTILYDRMNTFLTQMQAYVNGEFDPNLSTTTQTSESEKQQLQEFIYSKNGTY
ncbi:MAG: hypothetical protein LBG52_04940 [Candidatus Peribacteria bacterium]|nr:hypothetical protein [Candidatus Peribacteria bacterium]